MALLAGLLVVLPASTATVEAAQTGFAMTTVRSTTVDPATGRVFVAGDDKVEVFAADGSAVGTVTGLEGASGMDVDGGKLYIAETSAGTVSRVDTSTLAVEQTWPIGTTVTGSVAVIDGVVWLTTGQGISAALSTLDPVTGTVTPRGGSFPASRIVEIPGRTDRIIVHDRGVSPYSVYDVDITGPTVAILGDVPHGVGSNLREVAVNATGTRFVTASGAPAQFTEFDYPTMAPTGVIYQGTHYPNGVDYNPAMGGVYVASVSSSRLIYAFKEGIPNALVTHNTGSQIVESTVAVAADATAVYAVTEGSGATGRNLVYVSLEPQITNALPSAVIADVPVVVELAGTGLGYVTSADVGGVPADVEVLSTTEVRLAMPTGLSPGSHPISLDTPLGVATWPIEVQPNVGAELSGTVRSGVTPIGGIELTLTGGPLGTPRTTTSAASGAYAFDGLPWADDYRLELHDPSGVHADQVISGITAEPNLTTGLDIDLSATVPTPSADPVASTVALPGVARALVVHEETGRTFVSAGDEVLAVDAEGRLLGRIRDQWSAHGLALVGDDLFVNQRTAGAVSRISVNTLAVEAEHPTTTTTNGHLAHAGGRLWFTNDDNQWMGLSSMDPATGAVVVGSTHGLYNAGLGTVADEPNRLLAWSRGMSPARIEVYDVATTTPTFVARNPHGSLSGAGPAVASGAANRVWGLGGKEFTLDSMQPTGVVYPTAGGGLARSAASGGLLAFGSKVSAQGAPSTIATLGFAPQADAMGFSPDGSSVVAGRSGASELVIWNLEPIVTTVSPSTVVDDVPTPLTVEGHNLEGATSVAIQGFDATFAAQPDGSLLVDVPSDVSPGTRTIEVTTRFGEATTSLTVVVNTGATLNGTVRAGGEAIADIELTLDGGGLDDERVTTSASDGTFAFGAVPYGDDYVLDVHDPGGEHVDQQISGIALVPNETSELDIDLSAPAAPGPSAVVSSTPLAAPARALVVHPGTDRVFVSTGDEVRAFDQDGNLIGRVRQQYGAHGLAVVEGTLYVNQQTAGAVAAIDADTLEVTATRPTGTPTNGSLAFAGGRLWFTYGEGTFLYLASMDPGTGNVIVSSARARNPGLTSVTSQPNRLLAWNRGNSGGRVHVLDVANPASPTSASLSVGSFNSSGNFLASGASDRIWSYFGSEVSLSTVTPTGVQYASDGNAVAHTTMHSGLLAFGQTLFREGSPSAIGTIGVTPGNGTMTFDTTGDRLLVATTDQRLVVWDLGPHVTAVVPDIVRPGSPDTPVTLVGYGLGTVTAAAVDGVEVTPTVVSPTELSLVLPSSLTDVTEQTMLSVDLTSEFGTTTAAASILVDARPPSPPTSISASWTGAAVQVEWESPSDPGTSPVTHYEVTLDGDTTTVEAPATSTTLDGIAPGTHVVQVRAVSVDGTSTAGTTEVDVPAVPPSPPTDVVLQGAPAAVTLSWSPPLTSGSGPVSGYEIRYGDLALSFVVPADQHAVTIHPLTPGQPVWFAVRALSDAGPSAWVESAPVIPGTADALFTDVGWGHQFYWEILTAKQQGITTGYPDGSFGAGAVVSRQAAVVFLWRMAGAPTGHPDPGFSDVGPDHPFRDAIWWAASEGITEGYADGTFRGGDGVTRQAWMAFQWRAEGESPDYEVCTATFTDVGPAHPFFDAIRWAECVGIAQGYADGTFRPTAAVSRQAAIAFLVRPTWPRWEAMEV